MDNVHQRPQLPALSYLDMEKTKREEDAHQNRRNGTPQSLSTSASPTYHYPPGPPPPYSHVQNAPLPAHYANNCADPRPNTRTPPESRRTSEQEKEGTRHVKLSLPSISEALGGVDSKTSFASLPVSSQSSHLPQLSAVAPVSTSPPSRRSYPMEPPQPPPSVPGGTYSQHSQYRAEPRPLQHSNSMSSEPTQVHAAYPPLTETKPPVSMHSSPGRSMSAATPLRNGERSPPAEHSQPAVSMAPPGSFSYGYTAYPPRYANPTPPSSVSSDPIHQPSAVFGPQAATPGWRGEGVSRYDDRHSGSTNYGESVKRHLDFYDMENALNEIASSSVALSDFSRRYGDRMHQTQRSGPSLSSLPGLVEVDDMVAKTRMQYDSLIKIREVIIAQQRAYEQQAADQRHQHKAYAEVPQPQPEQHSSEPDEGQASGLAGADTKKRRGRAAPPGRCHSCNRAETPEWRRGPDGARTLCNACGLHYAKLTRKNNGANKGTAAGGSNLRPKEQGS